MEVQLMSICQKDGFATAKVMQYSKDCLSRLQDNLRACSHGAGSLESDSRDKMLKASQGQNIDKVQRTAGAWPWDVLRQESKATPVPVALDPGGWTVGPACI